VTINGKLNPCFSRLRGIEPVTRWASNVEGDPANFYVKLMFSLGKLYCSLNKMIMRLGELIKKAFVSESWRASYRKGAEYVEV